MKDEEIIELVRDRFVTTQQAAEIIGFEFTSAVNTLVKREQIKYYRLGGKLILIPRSAAEAYAANRPGKGGRPSKKG